MMAKLKDKSIRLWQALPLFSRIVLFLSLLSLVLHALAAFFPRLADFLSQTLGHGVRAALAFLTGWIPFSLAELFILGIPLWAVLLFLLVRRTAGDKRKARRFLAVLLSVLPLIYSLFVLTLGFGYLGTPLAEKLSLEQSEPTAEELYGAALWLSESAGEYEEGGQGSTLSPLSFSEANEALLRSYRTLEEKYSFLSSFSIGTKRVLLSEPMAYTGITGVYSFFTGEANVCDAYPDYSTVYTMAHEMAHARGVAREDEANFVAFLACISSDDAYIRYAGYTNLLQYVMNALYAKDTALHKEVYTALTPTVKQEYLAYNAFLSRFDGTVIDDVAGSINNAYLEGVGSGGTVSYSRVVLLATAYYKTIAEDGSP